MIRWPNEGPIPGRDSSSSRVAVLRLTMVGGPDPDEPELPPDTGGATGGPAPFFSTMTCCPSVSSAARLMLVRSAPGFAPPAASMASTTRDPTASWYTPGFWTRPATWTNTVVGDGDGAGPPDGEAPTGPPPGPPGSRAAVETLTGRGSDRTYQTPAPTRTTTPTTANPMIS